MATPPWPSWQHFNKCNGLEQVTATATATAIASEPAIATVINYNNTNSNRIAQQQAIAWLMVV